MTATSSRQERLLDRELNRLRQEWVAAWRAWTNVAGTAATTDTTLYDEQRSALRRYRAAEAAYFNHPRMRAPAS